MVTIHRGGLCVDSAYAGFSFDLVKYSGKGELGRRMLNNVS